MGETPEDPVYKKFPAPNGRFAVRLRVGNAIGNGSYDQAQIIDGRSKKVLFELKGIGGDDSAGAGGYGGGFGWFDEPPVIWSRDSRFVAVMCHDHRTGEIDVVECRKGQVRPCRLPEYPVKLIENEFESGRQWHTFLKPVRWTTGDVLVTNYSGTIRNYQNMPQRKDSEGQLGYEYTVLIEFNKSRNGKVISAKRTHWEHFYVP